MPQSHRDCLEFLMFHLDRVAKREPENLVCSNYKVPRADDRLTRNVDVAQELGCRLRPYDHARPQHRARDDRHARKESGCSVCYREQPDYLWRGIIAMTSAFVIPFAGGKPCLLNSIGGIMFATTSAFAFLTSINLFFKRLTNCLRGVRNHEPASDTCRSFHSRMEI